MKPLPERISFIERPLHRAIRDFAVQLGYKDVIYLNVGEPDFPTPQHIVDAAKTALDNGVHHYTEDRGTLELRQALTENLKHSRGLAVDPKGNVIITCGASEALAAAVLTLVGEGDEVIIPNPYYPPYIADIRIAGGKPVLVPVDNETLQWEGERVKDAVTARTKLIILNSPSNPTGGVYSKGFIREITDIARDKDIYILSDEVYDTFIYDTTFHSPTEFDPNLEHIILVNSLSKTFAMTGWRVGYIVGKPDLIADIVKIKGAINMCAPAMAQKAAVAALRGPRDCVETMLNEYRERRKMILDWCKKLPDVFLATPNGAFYIFPDFIQYEKDSLEFSKYLVKEAHVVVSPGVGFGSAGASNLRVSYASSRADLKEAFTRIEGALARYKPQ